MVIGGSMLLKGACRASQPHFRSKILQILCYVTYQNHLHLSPAIDSQGLSDGRTHGSRNGEVLDMFCLVVAGNQVSGQRA